MNSITNRIKRAVTIISALAVAGAALAEVEFKKQEGHVSPLQVKIAFTNGTVRTGMMTDMHWTGYVTDAFHFFGTSFEGGRLTLWLDTIRSVSEMTDKDCLVTFKSGTTRRIAREWFSVTLSSSEGGVESIDCSKIKGIEFLSSARHDKLNNAMYAQWNYSPFTGERLPIR